MLWKQSPQLVFIQKATKSIVCAAQLFMLLSISSCAQRSDVRSHSLITVSAAASLQDTLKDIQSDYEQAHPRDRIRYNFGASGAIAQQISQGAPTDVFISASERWLVQLEESDSLVKDSRQPLLTNNLVLVANPNSTINNIQDLTVDTVSKISVGEPQSVPLGSYTQEALASLNLSEKIKEKLVFAKDARQVLTYVETGNTTAGIIYQTDARLSQQIETVEIIPSHLHTPIRYSVAIVRQNQNQQNKDTQSAQSFIDFLYTQSAKDTFRRYGFEVVP